MNSHHVPRPQSHFLDPISRSHHSHDYRDIFLISVGKLSAPRSRIPFKATPSTTQQLCDIIKEQALPSLHCHCTVLAVIRGTPLAAVTQLCLDTGGGELIGTLAGTPCFSLQNICARKVMRDSKIHHPQLLHSRGCSAAFLLIHLGFWWIGWVFITGSSLTCVSQGALDAPVPGSEHLLEPWLKMSSSSAS